MAADGCWWWVWLLMDVVGGCGCLWVLLLVSVAANGCFWWVWLLMGVVGECGG